MIESQIAQLAAVVPSTDKGKILGQPEDLETANLVDVHNAGYYYTKPLIGAWKDESLPIKKGVGVFRPLTSKFVFARLARTVCSEDTSVYTGLG